MDVTKPDCYYCHLRLRCPPRHPRLRLYLGFALFFFSPQAITFVRTVTTSFHLVRRILISEYLSILTMDRLLGYDQVHNTSQWVHGSSVFLSDVMYCSHNDINNTIPMKSI